MTQGTMYIYYKDQMIKYRKYFSDKQRKMQLDIWEKEFGYKYAKCEIGYIPNTDERINKDGTNGKRNPRPQKVIEKAWKQEKSPFKKGDILKYGSPIGRKSMSNRKPTLSETESYRK